MAQCRRMCLRGSKIRRRIRHRRTTGSGPDEGAGDDRAGDCPARGDREHPARAHRWADRDRRARGAQLPELGWDQARDRLHPRVPVSGGEDGRGDHPQRERDEDRDGQRAADARPDDPVPRDGHPPPHGRARVQADRCARDRNLPAPRGRVGVCGWGQVHPRRHPRGARQGQPGAGDARQVPHPPGPGLHAPDRTGVRGRSDAARRADRAATLGSSSRAWPWRSSATSSSSAPRAG